MHKELKSRLIELCENQLKNKLNELQSLIEGSGAKENSENKSSAGDKHNTSQAMLHLEQEKNAKIYADVKRQYHFFKSIQFKSKYQKVEIGSLVKTNHLTLFIAVNLGKICVENQEIYCISSASPLGQNLVGKQINDTVKANSNPIKIIDLC